MVSTFIMNFFEKNVKKQKKLLILIAQNMKMWRISQTQATICYQRGF